MTARPLLALPCLLLCAFALAGPADASELTDYARGWCDGYKHARDVAKRNRTRALLFSSPSTSDPRADDPIDKLLPHLFTGKVTLPDGRVIVCEEPAS